MTVRWAMIAIGTSFVGCTGASAEGPENAAQLAVATNFEAQLVGPLLDEIRAGVRPFDEQGLGLCRGAQTCETFLGQSVEEPLAPGEYGLYAALRVPPVGAPGTWKVKVTTACTGEGAEATPYTREHEVTAPRGKNARPFRVLLQRVTSPHPDGPRACTWTLEAPHPDRTITYEGSWSTP
ncbi:MAG: hypothetical protein AAGA48_02460 [Myxococcota bacterium]